MVIRLTVDLTFDKETEKWHTTVSDIQFNKTLTDTMPYQLFSEIRKLLKGGQECKS